MNLKILVLIALLLVPLSGIGVDLYTPSFPAIAKYFNVHASLVKFTLTTYLLGFALGQVFFGTLSDFWGRRWLLIFGLACFLVASIVIPFTHSIYIVLIMRALQGFGGGASSSISKTLVSDTMTGKQHAVTMIYFTIVWALGPILAPAIGGYLQFYFSWHANFYAYFLYAVLLITLCLFLLKETHHERPHMDLKAIVCKYKTVLSHRHFVGGILILGFGYSTIVIFNIMGPFLIQRTMGFNAVVFGHLALLIGFCYFLGTLSSRFLMNYLGTKTLIAIGLCITLLASILGLLISFIFKTNLINLIIPIVIILYALGIVFSSCMAKTMSIFIEISGIASATLGTVISLVTTSSSFAVGFLPATSARIMMWTYLAFALIHWVIYFSLFREN